MEQTRHKARPPRPRDPKGSMPFREFHGSARQGSSIVIVQQEPLFRNEVQVRKKCGSESLFMFCSFRNNDSCLNNDNATSLSHWIMELMTCTPRHTTPWQGQGRASPAAHTTSLLVLVAPKEQDPKKNKLTENTSIPTYSGCFAFVLLVVASI
jgi:hypothetical protein